MLGKLIAIVLVGLAPAYAAEPPHKSIDHRYWKCNESRSLEGGIYGKGPFKKFGPPGSCARDAWIELSQSEFMALASEWYGFDWSNEIPFWNDDSPIERGAHDDDSSNP